MGFAIDLSDTRCVDQDNFVGIIPRDFVSIDRGSASDIGCKNIAASQ